MPPDDRIIIDYYLYVKCILTQAGTINKHTFCTINEKTGIKA